MAGHSKWSKVKHTKGPLDQNALRQANEQMEGQKLVFAPETHAAVDDPIAIRLIEALEDSDDEALAQISH